MEKERDDYIDRVRLEELSASNEREDMDKQLGDHKRKLDRLDKSIESERKEKKELSDRLEDMNNKMRELDNINDGLNKRIAQVKMMIYDNTERRFII